VIAVMQQYLDAPITFGERYNKVVEIWSGVTEKWPTRCSAACRGRQGRHINPIYVMADSARATEAADPQLSGMRD